MSVVETDCWVVAYIGRAAIRTFLFSCGDRQYLHACHLAKLTGLAATEERRFETHHDGYFCGALRALSDKHYISYGSFD